MLVVLDCHLKFLLIADSVLRTWLDSGVVPSVLLLLVLNSRVLLAEWISVADLHRWLLLPDRVVKLLPLVERIPDASGAVLVEAVDGVAS
jgi:hypothetical protein